MDIWKRFGQQALCLLAITGLAGCYESNAKGLSIKYEDITPVNTAGAYGADENTPPEICGFIPYVTNNLSTATETLLLTYVLDSGEIGKISGWREGVPIRVIKPGETLPKRPDGTELVAPNNKWFIYASCEQFLRSELKVQQCINGTCSDWEVEVSEQGRRE